MASTKVGRNLARVRGLGLALYAIPFLLSCGGTTGNVGGGGQTNGTGGSVSTGGGAGTGGRSCVSDADCPASGLCGYPSSTGCSATGRCFPAPGARCNAFLPGCACDGSVINTVCTGLPAGYVSKPLAHAGQCTLADAGSDACVSGGCLSTTTCTDDSQCAALGSHCDTCLELCGCGSASTFACGTALSCASATQYCSVAEGGPCCNPPSYTCADIPAACASNRSCACIRTAVGAQMCSDSNGGVTVTFQYP